MSVVGGQWKTMRGEKLTLKGRFTGFDSYGNMTYDPISLVSLGQDLPEPVPLAPTLTVTQPSRTTASLTFNIEDQGGNPPVQNWIIQRRQSSDGGATWSSYAAIAGSPFALSATAVTDTQLPTGTPEIKFQYRVQGVNVSGPGAWSNVATIQWAAVVLQQPLPPTNFSLTAKTQTTRTAVWSAYADSSVTKLGIIDNDNGKILVDSVSVSAVSAVIDNLTAGATYDNIGVAAYNGWNGAGAGGLAGWSSASNLQTFTQPTDDVVVTSDMMMGCNLKNDRGNIAYWDGYRIYSEGAMYDECPPIKTTNVPKYFAYSKTGSNLGGTNPSYSAVLAEVKADLEAFYYTSTGGHSVRWGIKVFWSNGNENSDKGALSLTTKGQQHTAAQIAAYKLSMQGLYDAVHTLNPDGSRRYPDAYAGSNPTQNHELDGIVQDWLYATAEFHDFVMWSHYPPGRASTAADPTYNWDSMKDSDATNRQTGFLTRTYVRTKGAQDVAQSRVPGHTIMIGTGEVGIGDDPSDTTTRPYYVVFALAGTMVKLADAHGLNHAFACWWDNDIGGGENEFSEEPASTNPSTAKAWHDWRLYHPQFGGSKPSSWVGNPKAAWKTTGPVS